MSRQRMGVSGEKERGSGDREPGRVGPNQDVYNAH